MRRLALLLLLPLALTAAAACSSDDADPLSGESDDFGIPAIDEPVKLVDPGAEPRQALRLDPPEGCEIPIRLEQDIENHTVVDGVDQDLAVKTQQDLVIRCRKLTDDRIEAVLSWVDARALTGPSATRATMRALQGATLRATFDRTGAVIGRPEAHVDDDALVAGLSAALEQQLTALLVQLVARFPEEPVGIGAKWQTSTDADVNTIPTTLTTDYLLVGVDGGKAALQVVQHYEFRRGEFGFGGGDDPVPANVIAGSLTARGTATWDLHGVLPLRSVVLDGEDTIDVDNGLETVRTHETVHQTTAVAAR